MRLRPAARSPGARRSFLIATLVLLTLGSGCAGNYRMTVAENLISYDRPFTDAAAEVVRKDADMLCRDRSRLAIQVSNACDMTRCFTDYQCVTKSGAEIIVR